MQFKKLAGSFENADTRWKINEEYTWAVAMLVKALGDEDVDQIRPSQIDKVLIQLDQDGLSRHGNWDAAKVNDEAGKVICKFLRWFSLEMAISQVNLDPWIPLVYRDLFPFYEDELERLWNAMEKRKDQGSYPHRDRALAALLLSTGMTYAEAATLKLRNLNRDPFTVVHPVSYGRFPFLMPKGKMMLHYWMERSFKDNDEPLFVTEAGEPLGEAGIRDLLVGYAREIDSYTSVVRFRRTFVKLHLDRGGSEEKLRYVLGYYKLNDLIRMLSITQETARADHRKASPVDNWDV